MPALVVSRPAEARAVAEFLAADSPEPSALLIEGDPGIGKTTLWLAGLEQAREHGFRVLSARPAVAESTLAYASLADLLSGVETAEWGDLPDPQRAAIDRIMLRTNETGAATNQHAVAAGFLSVLQSIGERAPLLVAIDDLQWLDASSKQVLTYAARRLSGAIRMLGSVRTAKDEPDAAPWLQLPNPAAIQPMRLRPLSLGALHAVVSARLGRRFSRPTMVRIHAVSGGNPFYAIELARGLDDGSPAAEMSLPTSLADLARTRVVDLNHDVYTALLATACLAAPTVELVARTTRTDVGRLTVLLEDAEGNDIIEIEGNRLRFTHPLLASGVYSQATAAQRRHMHRRLAEIVDQPELKARHLALATTSGDPATLQALDDGAETARRRGAPAAAAELLHLAIGLGGDTQERRIRSADHHFAAGDPERARGMLEETIEQLAPGMLRAEALNLLAVVRLFNDSHEEAAALFERALGEVGDQPALRAQILITLSFALFDAGDLTAAMRRAEDAVTQTRRLGQRQLLSQAVSMRVMLAFIRGDGFDEPSLRYALELEDRDADMPLACRPSMQHALLLGWTGQLERARHELRSVRLRCNERGDEGDLPFVTFFSALIEVWRGNFTEATQIAEDAMERALQLGGDIPRVVALTMRAVLAAYAGRVDEARRDDAEALAVGQRCGLHRLSVWQIATLGFLDVSLGNYIAALSTLEPLLGALKAAPDGTEIYVASFVPDAAEALIELGRLAEAEPLIEAIERNGRRLDRPWMLAVGARCRAMLLAAHGDLDAASVAAERSVVEHQRLPMPFERARTQLLLGQLQRRRRHKGAACATLREALGAFEDLGTSLWADRARAELARANIGPHRSAVLTPTEQQVAELTASGMTNRDVAAALFISPKTVEVNLTRIYRKLGIQSRAELGRRMDQLK